MKRYLILVIVFISLISISSCKKNFNYSDMDKVNYDKATYSLAIIDIDIFIECLQNLEKSLKEANNNLELILTHDDEALIPFIKTYSLKRFEDAKNYFKVVRIKVDKYRNKLIVFFSKNLVAKETFNLKVETLNNLIKEKESFIDEQILKCNNYILKNSKENNI